MRPTPAVVILALAGLSTAARAQALFELQVSRAGQEDWHSTINASPGDSVDVRVRVSYTGTASPLGLGSMIFQPTVSNWTPGAGGDALLPFINGGLGGQNSTPVGAVTDAPGQYGRVIPYATLAFGSTNYLRGFVNNVGGVNYLRIAQSYVTNWIGQSGNTTGGGGVNMRQLSDVGRTTNDPPFSPALQNIVIFKFGLTLSSTDLTPRTMDVDAPNDGFFLYSVSGLRDIGWYASMNEPVGTIRTVPTVVHGAINVVPAPGAMTAAIAGLLALTRRARRPAPAHQ